MNFLLFLTPDMRLFIRFFLFLCFFLLVGYGHLYSHTNPMRVGYVQQRLSERSEHASSFIPQHCEARIKKPGSSGTKKEWEKIRATEDMEEDDENESNASKKYSGSNHHCITFCYTLAPDSFFSYHKSRLPACAFFPFCASNKFILHRVIKV
jgi:hypothetical protein